MQLLLQETKALRQEQTGQRHNAPGIFYLNHIEAPAAQKLLTLNYRPSFDVGFCVLPIKSEAEVTLLVVVLRSSVSEPGASGTPLGQQKQLTIHEYFLHIFPTDLHNLISYTD